MFYIQESGENGWQGAYKNCHDDERQKVNIYNYIRRLFRKKLTYQQVWKSFVKFAVAYVCFYLIYECNYMGLVRKNDLYT